MRKGFQLLQGQYVHLCQAGEREEQAKAHDLGHAYVAMAVRGRVLVAVDFAREKGAAYQETDLDANDAKNNDAERQVKVGHLLALMVLNEQVNVGCHVQIVEQASENAFEDEAGEWKTFSALRVFVSGH